MSLLQKLLLLIYIRCRYYKNYCSWSIYYPHFSSFEVKPSSGCGWMGVRRKEWHRTALLRSRDEPAPPFSTDPLINCSWLEEVGAYSNFIYYLLFLLSLICCVQSSVIHWMMFGRTTWHRVLGPICFRVRPILVFVASGPWKIPRIILEDVHRLPVPMTKKIAIFTCLVD